MRSRGIRPEQVAEAYVSTGPGSYTGIRVSLAFVRTLGQLMPQLKLVAVPTALAVAENVASRQWENLGVLLAARENIPWGVQVGRDESGNPKFTGQPVVSPIEDLIDRWGTPLLLTGEGLGYCEIPELEGVEIVEQKDRFPSIKSVWAVGRRLANSNKYVNFSELLPRYARRPEAVRLWEQRKDKA